MPGESSKPRCIPGWNRKLLVSQRDAAKKWVLAEMKKTIYYDAGGTIGPTNDDVYAWLWHSLHHSKSRRIRRDVWETTNIESGWSAKVRFACENARLIIAEMKSHVSGDTGGPPPDL